MAELMEKEYGGAAVGGGQTGKRNLKNFLHEKFIISCYTLAW